MRNHSTCARAHSYLLVAATAANPEKRGSNSKQTQSNLAVISPFHTGSRSTTVYFWWWWTHSLSGCREQNSGVGQDQVQAANFHRQGLDPRSDPSRNRAVAAEINKALAAPRTLNPGGNRITTSGRSNAASDLGNMTGEQNLSAALNLEAALMSNHITPEKAMELSNQFLTVLAELVKRMPPPVSLQQSTIDLEGSYSEVFTPTVRILENGSIF